MPKKNRCQGHEPGPGEPMGVTVYCDGSCVRIPAVRPLRSPLPAKPNPFEVRTPNPVAVFRRNANNATVTVWQSAPTETLNSGSADHTIPRFSVSIEHASHMYPIEVLALIGSLQEALREIERIEKEREADPSRFTLPTL